MPLLAVVVLVCERESNGRETVEGSRVGWAVRGLGGRLATPPRREKD